MDETGQAHIHIQRMRERVRAAEAEAERTDDPEERERLRREIRRIRFDCEQESMMAAGDIYPTE